MQFDLIVKEPLQVLAHINLNVKMLSRARCKVALLFIRTESFG